ncbi:uncharacterized protein LOC142170412 [Nicotiana tabacum]|uniref:Uncharacterized protein LOC142170412 n=1 Tax=Nicotiana tabacum TaxID=4097 RepID=A0AC58STX6_TOBAC
MYKDLREIYWWNWMKENILDFVARCLNCQQVKAEHQRPGGLAQNIEIPLWKWEMINMDFVVGLPRTRLKHDSIWVGLLGPNLVHDALEKGALIQQRLKTAKSRQKSYTNVHRRKLEFKEGDQVFLKVSPMKSVMR